MCQTGLFKSRVSDSVTWKMFTKDLAPAYVFHLLATLLAPSSVSVPPWRSNLSLCRSDMAQWGQPTHLPTTPSKRASLWSAWDVAFLVLNLVWFTPLNSSSSHKICIWILPLGSGVGYLCKFNGLEGREVNSQREVRVFWSKKEGIRYWVNDQ